MLLIGDQIYQAPVVVDNSPTANHAAGSNFWNIAVLLICGALLAFTHH